MRVLVTGGSGFIGSHVVDKLRARGHEPVIYDLRPSPWHHGSRPPGRHRAGVDHRPRGARARAAQLRRRRPPRRRRRRQRRPCRARGRRARQRPRHRGRARGGPARRGQADRLRLDDLGLLRLRARGGRRGHAAAAAQPPLHEHQAGRRAVLQGLPGALRDRLHDPALRDPLRPARARGGGDPGVRQQGAGRRPADPGRRRQPVAQVRLRRGSRRRRRARARATWPSTASTTWPATRPSRSSRSPRRSRS